MSDELRRAAALMRKRAEDATPGPWWAEGSWFERAYGVDGRIEHIPHPIVGHGRTGADLIAKTVRKDQADARHIASWHPGVALAVADWLDREAGQADRCYGDPGGGAPIYGAADPAALDVARAYLGHDTEAAER